MKIRIVHEHPDRTSLSHAIAHAVRDEMRESWNDVVFHDLCAERVDSLPMGDEVTRRR